ncbi:Isochorismatase hydrolase [Rickenella mellea]|uniref:Isochorismatase hydrolase n=1 Tax=Rickenella mellea TaxID=50990 RepID=A0A4Y7QP38_9AGAM|nr:Isochorismatase hydrolase [Rickenella mellea]
MEKWDKECTSIPFHDTPVLAMSTRHRGERPRVEEPVEYGNASSFWIEYPSGLVDLSRTGHLGKDSNHDGTPTPPPTSALQLDVPVDGNRTVRVNKERTALVVIDMQNFFLHPDLRSHPTGLKCVDPLLAVIPPLRAQGIKVIWLNWGLTPHELTTIPPALSRSFKKSGRGGFGSEIPGNFGPLLMRGAFNSELYGPLQKEYTRGAELGTDVWIHKNRISGLWGPQSSLDLYLQEEGFTTLMFCGVNADQCVLGTVLDSYFRGYDCLLVKDAIATTSPEGGLENVLYNVGGSYGFVTNTSRIAEAVEKGELRRKDNV